MEAIKRRVQGKIDPFRAVPRVLGDEPKAALRYRRDSIIPHTRIRMRKIRFDVGDSGRRCPTLGPPTAATAGAHVLIVPAMLTPA
jgi:hypothetical protein